jgi:hypothetical protein
MIHMKTQRKGMEMYKFSKVALFAGLDVPNGIFFHICYIRNKEIF